MNKYIDLGNKYVARKKMRAAMVIISMILASSLIYIIVAAVLGTLLHKQKIAEEHANYYVFIPSVTDAQQQVIENHANVAGTVRGKIISASESEEMHIIGGYSWRALAIVKLETMEQDIFGYTLLEGEAPKNSDEIMLNERVLNSLAEEKKIGDTIEVDTITYDAYGEEDSHSIREYILCGIYENEWESSDWRLWGYTLAEPDEELVSYVRFHRKYHWKKDAGSLAEAAGVTADQYGRKYYQNYELEDFYLQNESVFIMFILVLMLALLLIYFCMVMIRSLMSTNVIDKLRDYTILKSLGATNKQLRKIFMRENLLEGAIAYVGGIILGQFLLSVVLVRLFEVYTLSFSYIWLALIVNAVFLWITIELAAIEPFVMLKRQTITEGLGQSKQIKKSRKGKKKKRPSLFYKMLSIEGQYAYKNIHRNSKSFWNPVAAFTLSILIVTMLMTINHNLQFVEEPLTYIMANDKYLYDIDVYIFYGDYDEAATINKKELLNHAEAALRDREEVKNIYPYMNVLMPKNENDKHFIIKPETWIFLRQYFSVSPDVITVRLMIKEELVKLNPYMLDGKDAYEAIKDGGILVPNLLTTSDGKQYQFFNIEEGDMVSIGNLELYAERYLKTGETEIEFIRYAEEHNGYMNVPVCGILETNTLTGDYPDSVIMSYEYIRDTCGQEFLDEKINGFHLDIDDKNFNSDIFTAVVEGQPALLAWNYADPTKTIDESMKSSQYTALLIGVFIMILGIVSVFSTMINEWLQRKKENAILRAIGMSKRGLNKMLIMEKLLIGFTAWVIGTAIAYGLSWLFLVAFLPLVGNKYAFPWYACGITGVFMLVITVLMSWPMIHMAGKLDISEGVRNET